MTLFPQHENTQTHSTIDGNQRDADEIIVVEERNPTTNRISEASILTHQQQQSNSGDNDNIATISAHDLNNDFRFRSIFNGNDQIQIIDGVEDDITQNLVEFLANSTDNAQPIQIANASQMPTTDGQEVCSDSTGTENSCRQDRPIFRAKLIVPPNPSPQLSSFEADSIVGNGDETECSSISAREADADVIFECAISNAAADELEGREDVEIGSIPIHIID